MKNNRGKGKESFRFYGQILRRKRKELGLTIEKAAELGNLSSRGYAKIEKGTGDPKFSSVLRLAAAYGMDLGELNDCIRNDSIPIEKNP